MNSTRLFSRKSIFIFKNKSRNFPSENEETNYRKSSNFAHQKGRFGKNKKISWLSLHARKKEPSLRKFSRKIKGGRRQATILANFCFFLSVVKINGSLFKIKERYRPQMFGETRGTILGSLKATRPFIYFIQKFKKQKNYDRFKSKHRFFGTQYGRKSKAGVPLHLIIHRKIMYCAEKQSGRGQKV